MGNPVAMLGELGIDRDSYRVLALLPLVYVAWADGAVQRSERSLILELARDKGWLAGKGEQILAGWLEKAPTADELRHGLQTLQSLAERDGGVGASIHAETLPSLLALCKQVAEAAGGMLGLGQAVTPEEEDALGTIAGALGIGNGDWRAAAEEGAKGRTAPGPRGGFALSGVMELMRDPLGWAMRARETYGEVSRFPLMGFETFLVCHPDHVAYVLNDNAANYPRGRDFEMIAERAGKSMLTTEGEAWKRLRRIANPAFHKSSLDPLGATVARLTGDTLQRWQPLADENATIDVAEQMVHITLRVIGYLMCSRDLSDSTSDIGAAVQVAIHHLSDVLINPFHMPEAIPTPANRRFKDAMKVFDELILGLIAERRDDPGEAHDLLGMLLSARDEEGGGGLSDEEIRNELLTFLVAGHETTAVALTWTLYFLSRHPMAARRLYAEVDEVLGGEVPTVEMLGKLEYTEMFLWEAMRLVPPFWAVGRSCAAEDFIGGYRIPKGASIMLCQWVTHRHPDFWENPEGFDPERHSPEHSEKQHKMAHFAFLAGPHKCIGKPLSMMEMKIIVPMIVQRFRLDLLPGYQPELDVSVSVRPRGGLPMRIRHRSR